jgi:uncharacterized surface protein with fasciclin (FAS1) repeats
MLRRTMLAGLASLTLVGGCASSGGSGGRTPGGPGQRDILVTLRREPDFRTLAEWINAADYAPKLRRLAPVTLFAPNETAFAEIRPGLRGRLLRPENRDLLRAVLDRHVVAGRITRDEMVQKRRLRTIDGGEVAITHQGQSLRFGSGNLVRLNIGTDIGVIHAIDRVQLPPHFF